MHVRYVCMYIGMNACRNACMFILLVYICIYIYILEMHTFIYMLGINVFPGTLTFMYVCIYVCLYVF
jgi:hypothetical protein